MFSRISLIIASLLFLLSACSSSNPKADQVALIGSELPTKCKFVGEVMSKNISYEKALIEIKAMTFDLGGRVVQVTKETRETLSVILEGKAYKCN